MRVSTPDDSFEQEAHRVADQVTQGGAAARVGWSLSRISVGSPGEYNSDTAEGSRRVLGGALPYSAPADELDAKTSQGQELGPRVRAFFESRFDRDLSNVKVHSDESAAHASERLHARAFTLGADIFFGGGEYRPDSSEGAHLLAHELTHVVQQTGGVPSIGIARKEIASTDITKLDAEALENRARSLHAWFGDHLVDDPEYSLKLQLAVDVYVEISARGNAPATPAQIETFKASQVAQSPRTAFERRIHRGELPTFKPVWDNGVVVGYSRSSGGYSEVVDVDGKIVWSHEIPLETPLIDPIDLIPFELLGSLAAKAATIGARALVKTAVKVLAKDAGKVVVEEGAKIATKELAGAAGKTGAGVVAEDAAKAATERAGKAVAGDAAKALAGDTSKTAVDALVQVFRKGEKVKSIGAVSLNRLRNILGRAGVSPSPYKLLKVPKEVAAAMEKEVGEPIWGFVNRTGEGVARDLKGRPIINFTPRALASLEEAIKTFGHEAKHLKDFAAGLTTSSEALAEKEGEKLWLIVQQGLER